MIGLIGKLRQRTSPIRVALVGAGYVGAGLFNAIRHVENMEVVAVYDPDPQLAAALGVRALRTPEELADLEYDVLADADCRPSVGADCSLHALHSGRHVVSINIECDMTVGPQLAVLAAENVCIYTVTAGDEPGELKAMHDHYALLGFRIVALGKGKNNPLNVRATPDTVRPSLPDNGITADQVCGFVDGSKTMFEMGCIANAIGFAPDVDGMHGPECAIADLATTFRSRDQGDGHRCQADQERDVGTGAVFHCASPYHIVGGWFCQLHAGQGHFVRGLACFGAKPSLAFLTTP